MDSSSADRDPLEIVADDFLARIRRGDAPRVSEYTEKYPDLAQQIEELIPTLRLMEVAAPGTVELKAATGSTVSDIGARKLERVGDYRILREIGRGAMGLVYEAEQQSLGRRVALKVLPPQLLNEQKALVRFRREARAAARLHHTNIVPVFEVGQDGDTWFYAMQYIRGQSLDKVLSELRHMRTAGDKEISPRGDNVEARSAALSLCRGRFGEPDAEPEDRTVPYAGHSDELPTAAQVMESSASSSISSDSSLCQSQSRPPAYFLSVAQLAEQVASGLNYAHERSTVHRDIKPSNLLLDTNGVLWIADFGLAKFEDDGHTRTGDLVGTLRYMSPERFQGRCDSRADIYSLGVTLYEMLTLRPAFESLNQLELMDQISNLPPRPPRAVDPLIPRDLETIVMKAMDKEPARRYQTAQELEEDLHRFIHDEPILARKPSLAERFLRWGRRNKLVATLTATAACLIVMLTLVSSAFAIYWQGANRELETRIKSEQRATLDAETKGAAAERARDEYNWQLYLANMRLLQQSFYDGNIVLVEELLQKCQPEPDQKDHRGWEWYYWWNQLRGYNTRMQMDNISQVGRWRFTCIAKSPVAPTAAIGHADGKVTIFDVEERRSIEQVLTASGVHVQKVTYLRNGSILAAAAGRTIYFWDTTTWLSLPTLTVAGHCYSLTSSDDGPHGGVLAAGIGSNSVVVWSSSSWQVVAELKCDHPPRSLAFSNDGTLLVAGTAFDAGDLWEPSLSGGLTAWNVDDWNEKECLDQPTSGIISVAFSPDGQWLASGQLDRTVQLWDLATLRKEHVFSTFGPARTVAFSPDAQLLAAGSGKDNAIRVWDLSNQSLVTILKGHSFFVTDVAFMDDSSTLISTSWDTGGIRLWDIKAISEQAVVRGQYRRLAFSPNNKTLFAVSDEGLIHAFDAHTLAAASHWDDNNRYQRVGFSDDRRIMATLDSVGTLRLHWLESNQPPTEYHLDDGVAVPAYQTHDAGRVVLNRDGTYVLWDEEDNGMQSIVLYNTSTGTKSTIATAKTCYAIAVSEHNQALLVIDEAATVWDLNTGKLCWNVASPAQRICAVSPDGARFVYGEGLRDIMMYDTSDFHLLTAFRGHHGWPSCMAFSPDGTLLVSGGCDDTVRVWDVESGELRATLTGHRANVRDVTFSPDMRMIASCSFDGTLRIWRTATTDEVKAANQDTAAR